jgi:16S rRNA (cytidine1402-2'-O)-methyltransferase
LTRESPPAGKLWIVATPVGNLDDLSPRAERALADADVIAAEDTRTSRKLLPSRRTAPRWVALHEHNEARGVEGLVECLLAGQNVALVSDAGTPLISDPGYRLVSRAHELGIPVSTVPGPCAAIAALSVSGLPTDRFRFEGFLPARSAARQRRIEELRAEAATLVFYAPARDLADVLDDAASVLGGERTATVARELTKQFETVRRGRLDELAEWVSGDSDQRRGEAVLVVEGAAERRAASGIDASRLARELLSELPPARAARVLARTTDLDRRAAFELVESLKEAPCT